MVNIYKFRIKNTEIKKWNKNQWYIIKPYFIIYLDIAIDIG